MATQEQLERSLRAAHKAGDTKAATKLAAALRAARAGATDMQKSVTAGATEGTIVPTNDYKSKTDKRDEMVQGLQQQKRQADYANIPQSSIKQEKWNDFKKSNPIAAKDIENMGGLEAFLIGAGEGLTNVARGAGLAEQADESDKQAMDMLRGQRGAALGGAIAGEALPFVIPGGAINKIGSTGYRMAAGAGLGATEGGVLARGQGAEGGQIFEAAALGGVLGPAMDMVPGAISRATRPKADTAKIISDAQAQAVPKADAILKGQSGGITALTDAELAAENVASRQLRRQAFEDAGVTPTEANLSRNDALLRKQSELSKNPGVVTDTMKLQNEQVKEKLTGMKQATGGNEYQPSSVHDAVVDRVTKEDDLISSKYKEVEGMLPDQKTVRFDTVGKFYNNNKGELIASKVLTPMLSKMQQAGILDDKMKPLSRISPAQAELVRQEANKFYKTASPRDRELLAELKDSMDDDVFRTAGADYYKEARDAKTAMERALDPVRVNKRDNRNVTLVRDIANQKVTTENFQKKIFAPDSKYNASDLRHLKDYTKDSDTWKDVKAAAMNQITERAFKGGLNTETDIGKFRAAINSIGDDKLKVIFDPEEIDMLKTMGRVIAFKDTPKGVRKQDSEIATPIMKERLKRTAENLARIPGLGAGFDFIQLKLEKMITKGDERAVLKVLDDFDEAIKEANKRAGKERTKAIRSNPVTPYAGSATQAAAVRGGEVVDYMSEEDE